MRPNLTVTSIAGALAVLGTTTALVACGGDKPPVNANEVKSAEPTKASEGHCGADHKDHKGDAKCGAKDGSAASAASSAASPTGGATSAPTTATAPTATTVPASPAPSSSATPASSAKPGGTPGKSPPKAGGQASCGAGTCSAKK